MTHGRPRGGPVSSESNRIRAQILDLAAVNSNLTVQNAYESLRKRDPNLSEELFLDEVLGLKSDGTLTLHNTGA